MNPGTHFRIFLAILSGASLVGCVGVDAEKEAVVAKARAIHGFPVSRDTLLVSFDLGKKSGVRLDGGIRNGWMSHTETWEHSSGLTITASDFQFVGGKVVIDRRSIDEILNDQSRTAEDFVGEPFFMGPPHESFHSFAVMDGKKVLFQSEEADRDPRR